MLHRSGGSDVCAFLRAAAHATAPHTGHVYVAAFVLLFPLPEKQPVCRLGGRAGVCVCVCVCVCALSRNLCTHALWLHMARRQEVVPRTLRAPRVGCVAVAAVTAKPVCTIPVQSPCQVHGFGSRLWMDGGSPNGGATSVGLPLLPEEVHAHVLWS